MQKFVRGTPPNDTGNDDADVICDADRTPYGAVPAEWKNSAPPIHSDTSSGGTSPAVFGSVLSLFAVIFAVIATF